MNKDGKSYSFYHEPFNNIRCGKPDEDGNVSEMWICKDWTETAKYKPFTLPRFGFNEDEVGGVLGDLHYDVYFKINNKKYIVNISRDLTNIQIGAKTRYFGSNLSKGNNSSYFILDEEKILEIDKKLGYFIFVLLILGFGSVIISGFTPSLTSDGRIYLNYLFVILLNLILLLMV